MESRRRGGARRNRQHVYRYSMQSTSYSFSRSRLEVVSFKVLQCRNELLARDTRRFPIIRVGVKENSKYLS